MPLRLNRLTNWLDGLGQTRYTYAVLGNGQRTFTEDGPWAADVSVGRARLPCVPSRLEGCPARALAGNRR